MNIKHALIGIVLYAVGYFGMSSAMDVWEIPLINQTDLAFRVSTPAVFRYGGDDQVISGEGWLQPGAELVCRVPAESEPYDLGMRQGIYLTQGHYIWHNIQNMSAQSTFRLIPAANNGVQLMHRPSQQDQEVNVGVAYPMGWQRTRGRSRYE